MMMNEELDNILEISDEELEGVTGGKDFRIKASEANVRSGPGKDFGINGRLKKGEKVTYLGDKKKDNEGKTWLYISNGYINGWVRKDLLKK